MKRSLLVCFLAIPLLAQPPTPEDDPIARMLFPPELIMNHQRELGLDSNQRNQIRKEVQAAQSKFFDYQWQMSEASEQMLALLQSSPVDEKKTLAQADQVMELERQIKKTHLGLLIRIRNLLTADQIAKLEQIRARPKP